MQKPWGLLERNDPSRSSRRTVSHLHSSSYSEEEEFVYRDRSPSCIKRFWGRKVSTSMLSGLSSTCQPARRTSTAAFISLPSPYHQRVTYISTGRLSSSRTQQQQQQQSHSVLFCSVRFGFFFSSSPDETRLPLAQCCLYLKLPLLWALHTFYMFGDGRPGTKAAAGAMTFFSPKLDSSSCSYKQRRRRRMEARPARNHRSVVFRLSPKQESFFRRPLCQLGFQVRLAK